MESASNKFYADWLLCLSIVTKMMYRVSTKSAVSSSNSKLLINEQSFDWRYFLSELKVFIHIAIRINIFRVVFILAISEILLLFYVFAVNSLQCLVLQLVLVQCTKVIQLQFGLAGISIHFHFLLQKSTYFHIYWHDGNERMFFMKIYFHLEVLAQ